MQSFQDLEVWQHSHRLTLALFSDPLELRDYRARSLAAQLWRAGCSIGANIAVGAGSVSRAQFARYLGLALASAHELENHLMLATDAGFLERADGELRLTELRRLKKMLWSLHNRVRRAARKPRPKELGVHPSPSTPIPDSPPSTVDR